MPVIAIAIVAANGVLGDGEKQPFEFPEDWARYKRVTLGHPMIMGRATHDAIGRWLPGRTTIIVTRTPQAVELPTDGRADGRAVASLDEALALARSLDDTVYVAGGGQVYAQAWDELDELDLTEVHADAEGSVVLPEVDPAVWEEYRREPRGAFDFVGYRRRARS
ncbi:dihydrofolate reductase [Propioniciclava sinopodophylli]|uniref:Dihydrofolate reductase n=1 Tax=Propioniciclava sinopodophylli TaxID=1837344 RepID=A0A4V2JSM4_9ACTN|nr:dihydrofolate reductase [Propioniciclava sinopodophylli]TBT86528.1 dihydrofolate reductase [Propioniciclava sinopodophylli]